jgi:branched-chain amino acid transport system ATP-binding protein
MSRTVQVFQVDAFTRQLFTGNPAGVVLGAEVLSDEEMLAIARALARDIKVLLLDEPYEGLAPVIVQEIAKTLSVIRDQGITTIIVEQNAVAALKLADRAVILDTGTVVYDGSAQEVLDDEALRAKYLAI